MSDSLRPHGLQHSRPPYPSPGVYWSSCPLSWWCHPTVSSSVIPFSSRLQSLQASGSFLMNQLFASGGQNIGASASTSVLPMNIQGWLPLGLKGNGKERFGWGPHKFAFLTTSQVMLMPVRWSHFGNHCSSIRFIAPNHNPLFMCLGFLETVNSWTRTVSFVFVFPGSSPLFVSQ